MLRRRPERLFQRSPVGSTVPDGATTSTVTTHVDGQMVLGGTRRRRPCRTTDAGPIHVLWINAGLSCDGDSVVLTAATQPSVEEIALGALPGLPAIAVHWPLIDFESGPVGGADDFLEWFRKADRGELEPFVLVVEGSIPNEELSGRGLLVRLRQRPGDRPADHHQRVARPPDAEGAGRRRRRHVRHLRRHPRHGRQPDRGDGRARLPRVGLEVEGRHPDRVRARLPDPPRQPRRDADATCCTWRPGRRR